MKNITVTTMQQLLEQLVQSMNWEEETFQAFVKNFMSFQTPYSSLLLYHGLGTGKTCSAMACSEVFFLEHCNIFVVCPDALKHNFRKQLFDDSIQEDKLTGEWKVSTKCPMKYIHKLVEECDRKTTSKTQMIKLINTYINKYYSFFNYDEFAHFLDSLVQNNYGLENIRKLHFELDHSLIIIDECHHLFGNSKLKKVLESEMLHRTDYKLLLMSATPIYDSVEEIIWLINLLNQRNPTRQKIHSIGENFIKEINGIISYVKGDNPFTFPIKIFSTLLMNESEEKINFDFAKTLHITENGNDKLSSIATIINDTPEGIVLVYIERNHDIQDFIDLLEKQNGMLRFHKKKPNISTRKYYIVLDSLSDLEIINCDDNKNGAIISCVIIDKRYSEGADFKCIRQIHVFEPCKTYTHLQQIIGRGCRSYSHTNLEPSKQNVQIFLHSLRNEITDYEDLFDSYQSINDVLDILRTPAVDAVLNSKQMEHYDLYPETIEVAWRKNKLNINFDNYFKLLDFFHL
jgi:hypothetical protein